jgi:hypothetical protein
LRAVFRRSVGFGAAASLPLEVLPVVDFVVRFFTVDLPLLFLVCVAALFLAGIVYVLIWYSGFVFWLNILGEFNVWL